jgi:hypothetical protein
MGEQPVQLLGDAREPMGMNERHSRREDNEYVRGGTCSVFIFVEPLGEDGMFRHRNEGQGKTGRGK